MSTPDPPNPPPESLLPGRANEALPGSPLSLTYDNYSAVKDPRARWVLPGFLVGMFLAGMFQSLIFGLIKRYAVADGGPLSGLDGFLVPAGFSIMLWLPASIALGISIWLRTKILKEVRFAKFKTALLLGILMGAIPWSAPGLFDILGGASLFWFFTMLGANIVLPAIAGIILCYRSNLRD